MSVDKKFNSKLVEAGCLNMINDISPPPCQNIMFPNLIYHKLYEHQPLINVPIRTTVTTLSELGASIDMLRAQVVELSTRMDAAESNFSEFKKSISNDIIVMKNIVSEHSTELLDVKDVAVNAYSDMNKTIELSLNLQSKLTLINEEQNICIDQLVNAVFKNNHLNKNQQKNKETIKMSSDLGMIRRRLSKVEDFTSQFYEEFESFKSVKEIITVLSDHINECDRDISMMVSTVSSKNSSDNKVECECHEDEALENIAEYFSNYDDKDDKSCACVTNGDDKSDTNETNNLVILMENNEEQNGDDDFEKIIIIG